MSRVMDAMRSWVNRDRDCLTGQKTSYKMSYISKTEKLK
jgi:hypothetical protein